MTSDDVTRVWIELDTLLDVRLATLHVLDSSSVVTALDRGYHERPIDDWGYLTDGKVTTDTFNIAYKDREKDILENALPTELLFFLRGMCDDLLTKRITTPFFDQVIIEVNTWPYRFTKEEEKVLCALVGHYVGEEVYVRTRREEIDFLTPRELRKNYHGVFLYDFDAWFRRHHKSLEKEGCPQVSVLTPALFINEVPDPETLKEELSDFETHDPFRLFEMSLIAKLHLQYLPVKYFSAAKPSSAS